MLEKYFQKKVIRVLESWGAVVVRQAYSTKAGISDLIVCYNGNFIAIELKVGRNKATPLQDHFIHEVHEAGGKAFVFNDQPNWKNALWLMIS